MTITPAPAPVAPQCCPACGAAIQSKWKSDSGLSDFIRYECGLEIHNKAMVKEWRIEWRCITHRQEWGMIMSELRSTVAALTARVKELETDCAALEYLDHEASIGADEVGRQVKELTARAEKAEAERDAAMDALVKFGRHEYTCVTTNYDRPKELGVKCDCGLGEVLSGVPEIDHAHEQEFDSWEPGNVERETE